jgi:methylated-DNA-[protein]-cysteine S-methyltransferase
VDDDDLRRGATYRMVDSSFGALLLAATGDGLVRIAFEVEGTDRVLDQLRSRLGEVRPGSTAQLERAVHQVHDFLDGRVTCFDLPLDLRLVAPGFRRRVLDHLAAIPYGRTRTYREVATAVGSPGATRAVGSACANNPLPLVIPCHRVVRSDGASGGFLAGGEVKGALLAIERLSRGSAEPGRSIG